jgi:GNAT superfamily N-acetyltransferase
MNSEILFAKPDQAKTLTQIAFAAKRHWGYPERWIKIWSPTLTVSEEFIERNDTYIAYLMGKPVGFYAISVENTKASLEHLWVLPSHMRKGIGAKLFKHALSRCKELELHTLEIESDPNAQGFYEHMGAKKVREAVGEVDGQLRVLPVLEITLL